MTSNDAFLSALLVTATDNVMRIVVCVGEARHCSIKQTLASQSSWQRQTKMSFRLEYKRRARKTVRKKVGLLII